MIPAAALDAKCSAIDRLASEGHAQPVMRFDVPDRSDGHRLICSGLIGQTFLPLCPTRLRHREEQLVIVPACESESPRAIQTLHGDQLIREWQTIDRKCRAHTARCGQLGKIREPLTNFLTFI